MAAVRGFRCLTPLRHSYRPLPSPSPLLFLRYHSNRANQRSVPTPPAAPHAPKAKDLPLSSTAVKATQPHPEPEGAHHDRHDMLGEVEHSVDVQRQKDWAIIKKLVPNIWPKDDWGTKSRVMIALGLLVGGKVSCCRFKHDLQEGLRRDSSRDNVKEGRGGAGGS